MMKRAYLISSIIVLVFSLNGLYAGEKGGKAAKMVTLTGTVIDQSNQEAIAGALIKIDGLEKEVYTDLDGNFKISGIIPDTYTIKCSMISYKDQEKEIEISQKNEKIKIQLKNFSGK
jgi:hypothetical protein